MLNYSEVMVSEEVVDSENVDSTSRIWSKEFEQRAKFWRGVKIFIISKRNIWDVLSFTHVSLGVLMRYFID